MKKPDVITHHEFSRALELLGWTLHVRIGPHRIFIKPPRRLLMAEANWSIPVEDVEANLQANDIPLEDFWKAYWSLY